MSAGEYLVSIDWLAGVGVAAVIVLVAIVLLRFLMATTSELGSMLPGIGNAAGRAVLDARGLPVDSWVCAVCRSVNMPHTTHCYRRCGPREAIAEELPEDRSLLADGTNGRRAPLAYGREIDILRPTRANDSSSS